VPIYFIGHSLGGLVIEQALLISLESDSSYKGFVPNTRGILFMGTPHLGSHLTKWATLLRRIIPPQIRKVNTDILEPLTKDSNLCAALEAQFQKMAKTGHFKNILLFSFYETKAMAGLTKLVVPRESGVLAADPCAPISSTHVGMVRFEGPNDSEYIKVKGQLKAWLEGSKDIPEAEKPNEEPKQEGKGKPAEQEPADGNLDEENPEGEPDEKVANTKKKGVKTNRNGINQKAFEVTGGTFNNSTLRANAVAAGRDLNYKNRMQTNNYYNKREDDSGDFDDDIGGRNTDSDISSDEDFAGEALKKVGEEKEGQEE
jgi:hypothetical protein